MSGIRTNQRFLAKYPQVALVLLPLFILAVAATNASAQIVSTDDGTATVVEAIGNQFDIKGGRLSDNEANLFHSFEQFDLSAEQTANFETISNVQNVIGKVSGRNASSIDGTLQVSGSNANLYLMNPAGILIGPNAQLNLSGGFTATTATGIEFEHGQFDASTANYGQLTGKPSGFRFANEQAGAVVNLGDLRVNQGKAIGLIGGTVINAGSLSAPEGTVTIAAVEGENLVRISQGDQLLSLEVAATESNNSAGAITAQSIGAMLTGSGLSEATALSVEPDGTVRLGSVAIDESGGSAIASGNLSTIGETGGDINVLGDRVSLIAAILDASGTNGGGLVRVGGDYQGKGTVTNAARTLVDGDSVISANALETGDGGRSIVWADDTTEFYGTINARGGVFGGDGGFAEISGKARLVAAGNVDLTAPQGSLGTVLLDPENLVITDELPTPPDNGTTSYLSSDYVENLSLGANVELEATNDFTIRPLAGGKLEFTPERSVTFRANSDGIGAGAFRMESGDTLRAERGNVFISGMGVSVGTINTSTASSGDHNRPGSVSGGNVELSSTLEVTASEILTYGEQTGNHARSGGSVTIEALNGDVVVSKAIKTYSNAGGHQSESGGYINIFASDGIDVGTTPTAENVLDSSSVAADHTSGEGGSITLTSGTGDIRIIGNISSRSSARNEQDFYSQRGGVVELRAQDGSIVTGDINTSARAGTDGLSNQSDAGDGGDVSLTAGVDISTGSINTTSEAEGDQSGDGGDVTLRAARTIRTKDITANSIAQRSNSENAGIIDIKAMAVAVEGGLSSLSINDGITENQSNSIWLTGDTIRFGNGANSVRGASVSITALNPFREIEVGGINNLDSALSITDAEIAAIGLNAERISIGAGSTGSVRLDSSVTAASASSRAPLEILGAETLIGSDESTIYDIQSEQGGRIVGSGNAVTRFSQVANIRAGQNDDTFKISGATGGNLSGGGGNNTLDYSGYTSAVNVNLSNASATGLSSFADISTLIGSRNADSIRGTNGDDTFKITGDRAGEVAGITFFDIESIAGEQGKDTLDYSSYGSAVEFNLAGLNSATGLSAFSNIERIIGSRQSDKLIGSNNDDTFNISGNGEGNINGDIEFFSIEEISGNQGNDTIRGASGNNTFEIQAFGAGRLNQTLTFSDFEQVQGNIGFDTLDYSNYGSKIAVSLETSQATGFAKFSEIEGFIGSANSTISGRDSGSRWTISGIDRGLVDDVSFENFNRLLGRGGDDIFSFERNGQIKGEIVGGNDDINAQNRIISAVENASWRLGAGKNVGTIEDAEGSVLAKFSQIQNLENNTTGGVHSVTFERYDSQITGSISSGNSDLILIGDDINIGNSDGNNNLVGGEISGSGTLTIRPRSANASIELGGTDSRGAALSITDGEIAAIQNSFSQVMIGDKTLTNRLSFRGDVSLGSSLSLQSRGEIDTDGYRLSAEGSVLVEGDRITAGAIESRDRVSLIAKRDIETGTISAEGQGVEVKSELGGILVEGAIAARGQLAGNRIRLSAPKDIVVGNITTEGGVGSGSVNISSALGGITASGITTRYLSSGAAASGPSGSVALEAPENIEVGFIDATGKGSSSNGSGFIRIETAEDFVATGYLSGTRMTLSTGIEGGTIEILYGRESRSAEPFIVGQPSRNGTAGSIIAAVEILSGEVPSGLSQGNITIIDRGYQLAESRAPVAPLKIVEPLTEQASAAEVVIRNSDSAMETLRNLESTMGGGFASYLSLSNNAVNKQAVTLSGMQKTLQAVAQKTGTTPALLYVYFVPDAASESAVAAENADKTALKESRLPAPEDQLEVMLINPTGEPIRKRQWGVTRAQVEAMSQALRQQVTSQFSLPRQYLAPAQQLYDWIIRPIDREMNNQQVNSIGFVMDTGLRTLPIAALHDGEQYLVENYSLGLLPTYSLTDFADGKEEGFDFETARVLAMGASQFADQPNLPAVDAEISVITAGLWEGDAFLNEDFVLENLQTQIRDQDYGVVHLATHASFEPGDLAKSYIQLWDEKLALSDIDQLGLDESNVGLIILSACSTALGDRASEYGFAGFAVNAGSRSAMASLWPVNDEGTLGFMSQFYGQLKQAPVKAEALRQAQISLLRGEVGVEDGVVYGAGREAIATLPSLADSGRWDFSHPFFWSAFTMIGNPW